MDLYITNIEAAYGDLTIPAATIFITEYNEGHGLGEMPDRFAFSAYILTETGKFESLGFMHEDCYASIGMYGTKDHPRPDYVPVNCIEYTGTLSSLNLSDLNTAQKATLKVRSLPSAEFFIADNLPLKKHHIVKPKTVLNWLSEKIISLSKYYTVGIDVDSIALNLMSAHNKAELSRRERIAASANSLGNMFPDLAKLK